MVIKGIRNARAGGSGLVLGHTSMWIEIASRAVLSEIDRNKHTSKNARGFFHVEA